MQIFKCSVIRSFWETSCHTQGSFKNLWIGALMLVAPLYSYSWFLWTQFLRDRNTNTEMIHTWTTWDIFPDIINTLYLTTGKSNFNYLLTTCSLRVEVFTSLTTNIVPPSIPIVHKTHFLVSIMLLTCDIWDSSKKIS